MAHLRRLRGDDLPAAVEVCGGEVHGYVVSARVPCPIHGGTDPNLHLWVDCDGLLAACCHSLRCPSLDILDEIERRIDAAGLERAPAAPREHVERPRVELPDDRLLARWGARLANGDDDALLARLDHLGWLDRRNEVAELGVGYAVASELAALGIKWAKDAIVFPQRDRSGLPVGIVRYRPGESNSRKVRATGRRELFPSPEQVAGDLIFLLEGERDAITASLSGLPAVGCPGAASWRDAWAERFTGRRVAVLFDPDVAGREGAERVVASLHAAGVRAVAIELERLTR